MFEEAFIHTGKRDTKCSFRINLAMEVHNHLLAEYLNYSLKEQSSFHILQQTNFCIFLTSA